MTLAFFRKSQARPLLHQGLGTLASTAAQFVLHAALHIVDPLEKEYTVQLATFSAGDGAILRLLQEVGAALNRRVLENRPAHPWTSSRQRIAAESDCRIL